MKKLLDTLVNGVAEAYSQMWKDTGLQLPLKRDWKDTRTQFDSLKEVVEGVGVTLVYLTTLAAQVCLVLAFLAWTYLNIPYSIWKNKQTTRRV